MKSRRLWYLAVPAMLFCLTALPGLAEQAKGDPKDATAIAFGILLGGTGEVRLRNVTFEVVGSNVPTTEKSMPAKPANLGFEK